MALVLTDLGADEILEMFLNNTRASGGNNLTLKLFTDSDVTPAQSTVTGDFTEASGGGYAAKTLTMGSWTVTPANDPSDAVYAEQTWTFTGALDASAAIYGYWVQDADGVCLWSELLTVPFTPANNGDQLNITPKIQLSSGTPS